MSQNNFIDWSDFSNLYPVVENWKEIQKEVLSLNCPIMNVHREGKHYDEVIRDILKELVNENEYGWIKGWGGEEKGNNDWLQLGLKSYSNEINNLFLNDWVSENMPITFRLINEIENLYICAIVNLKAGSMLPCHSHPYISEMNLLQMHLPLITAKENNYAYLNVNGEFRQHVEGVPLVFDGTNDHFALNESNVDRIIFYLEFVKPK